METNIMKVNSASSQKTTQSSKAPAKEDIKAKLEAKFGKKFGEKKVKKDPDVVVSIDKKGNKEVSTDGFGDIKDNDPKSEATQEKLKKILSTGAFNFNPKERDALKDILG